VNWKEEWQYSHVIVKVNFLPIQEKKEVYIFLEVNGVESWRRRIVMMIVMMMLMIMVGAITELEANMIAH